MPSVVVSGTTTGVVGTEQTLVSMPYPGVFMPIVDAHQLQQGDAVELRIYLRTLGSSVARVAYRSTFGPPIDDPVKVLPFVPVTHQMQVTLKQTIGTPRSFDWELIQT